MERNTNREGNTMKHTITILANLNSGDMIVRSSFRGVTRMTRVELAAHRESGCAITNKRRV
jgi:hypothetical protein